jgi:quercetin dioxygenase-like cupin family protein
MQIGVFVSQRNENMSVRNVILTACALGFAAAVGLTVATAQAPAPATQAGQGIKRTIVQKMDVPGTNLETIVAVVEIAPNFKAGRHTHPGNVTGYVLEGEFFVTLDGQSEKQLNAGDSLLIPDGTVHDEGTRDKAAKLFGVYVVEKGKPLAAPVK